MSQELNRWGNLIFFLIAFSLFMRAPNIIPPKFLYLSQNFIFYIFPNLQMNSLEPSIHAEYLPPF